MENQASSPVWAGNLHTALIPYKCALVHLISFAISIILMRQAYLILGYKAIHLQVAFCFIVMSYLGIQDRIKIGIGKELVLEKAWFQIIGGMLYAVFESLGIALGLYLQLTDSEQELVPIIAECVGWGLWFYICMFGLLSIGTVKLRAATNSLNPA